MHASLLCLSCASKVTKGGVTGGLVQILCVPDIIHVMLSTCVLCGVEPYHYFCEPHLPFFLQWKDVTKDKLMDTRLKCVFIEEPPSEVQKHAHTHCTLVPFNSRLTQCVCTQYTHISTCTVPLHRDLGQSRSAPPHLWSHLLSHQLWKTR